MERECTQQPIIAIARAVSLQNSYFQNKTLIKVKYFPAMLSGMKQNIALQTAIITSQR